MVRHLTTEWDTEGFLREFAPLPLSCVVDAMYRLGLPCSVMDPAIRQMAGPRIIGYARTLGRIPRPRNAPDGDEAALCGASLDAVVDSLSSGEVLVIATQDASHIGTFGDNLALRAMALGAAGVVTDGAIRDSVEIEALGFGTFAAGRSLIPSEGNLVSVSVDEPVICGGVRVQPGDLILGDTDGIVVVGEKDLRMVWMRAVEICDAEQEMQESLRQGLSLSEAACRYRLR